MVNKLRAFTVGITVYAIGLTYLSVKFVNHFDTYVDNVYKIARNTARNAYFVGCTHGYEIIVNLSKEKLPSYGSQVERCKGDSFDYQRRAFPNNPDEFKEYGTGN
jgi:hypothetical protein